MKHEVFFLTNAFPCISFRNINRGTLKNIREWISTSLSSIFGKHSLPVKTQFLRCELSNSYRFKQSSTFLDVVLSIYRFKKDCFPFKRWHKTLLKSKIYMAGGTYFEYFKDFNTTKSLSQPQ